MSKEQNEMEANRQAKQRTHALSMVILMCLGICSTAVSSTFLMEAQPQLTITETNTRVDPPIDLTTLVLPQDSNIIIPSSTDPLEQQAIDFVHSRQKEYQIKDRGEEWKLRGLGYLYTLQKIILLGRISGASGQHNNNHNNESQSSTIFHQPGRQSILIQNVHPSQEQDIMDCDLLTIWVRVNGPEMFAGSAKPTTQSNACVWEFSFLLQVPGSYHVDAKVLVWNGQAPVSFVPSFPRGSLSTACLHSSLTTYNDHYHHNNNSSNNNNGVHVLELTPAQLRGQEAIHRAPYLIPGISKDAKHKYYHRHVGMLGFKFYFPSISCCEICRRIPECQYWETPPLAMPDAKPSLTGCELYFKNDHPTNNETPYPKSYQYRLAVKEEREWRANQTLETLQTRKQAEKGFGYPSQWHPLANTNNNDDDYEDAASYYNTTTNQKDVAHFLGCGWSFQFTLNFPCISGDLDDHVFMPIQDFQLAAPAAAISTTTTTTTTTISAEEDTRETPKKRLCRVEDEKNSSQSLYPARGRWVREEWPNNLTCPFPLTMDQEFKQQFGITDNHNGRYPHCWHRDDFTLVGNRCKELNCGSIPSSSKWKTSTVMTESEWMGVYRPYTCDYLEFTNEELQTCISRRKIIQVEVIGSSIASFLRQYIDQRLDKIVMANPQNSYNTTRVTISTLSWPHALWRGGSMDEIRTQLNNPRTHQKGPILPSTHVERYWISPFYTTSEREPYVHIGRVEQFMEVAQEVLEPKGYKMINALDHSAAFSYDTATQRDGLHIIGPPMKMIVTAAFHHICASVFMEYDDEDGTTAYTAGSPL